MADLRMSKTNFQRKKKNCLVLKKNLSLLILLAQKLLKYSYAIKIFKLPKSIFSFGTTNQR